MKTDVATNEGWLMFFLRVVETRPGMYLGDESVGTLATYINGYGQAREDLGAERYGKDEETTLDDFGSWLKNRTGSRREMTWVGYVQEIDGSPKNIHVFFRLFRQFLNEQGKTMPDLEKSGQLWPVRKPFS